LQRITDCCRGKKRDWLSFSRRASRSKKEKSRRNKGISRSKKGRSRRRLPKRKLKVEPKKPI